MDTFGYSDIRTRVNIPLSDRHSSNLISPTESSTTSNEIPDDSGHGSSISGQTSDASVNDTSGLKADKQKGNRVQTEHGNGWPWHYKKHKIPRLLKWSTKFGRTFETYIESDVARKARIARQSRRNAMSNTALAGNQWPYEHITISRPILPDGHRQLSHDTSRPNAHGTNLAVQKDGVS